MNFKPLKIGNLVAKVPIIQGGMGIGVSLSSLAGAVSKEGAIGVISAAQTGFKSEQFNDKALECNINSLAYHIKEAKQISNNGIIGVNIMCAGNNYEKYVKCCVDNEADLIISGAGLPLQLPYLLKDTAIKFAPVVSSLKAVKVLFKKWHKMYKKLCDFVVIEGPKAGGHLGFKDDDITLYENGKNYDEEISDIINYVKTFESDYGEIPVIFAGGVYDKSDILHYINLGCSGVQMATRFVATYECDAPDSYKQAYLDATAEDIVIIKSPIGLPGRAINNDFLRGQGEEGVVLDGCSNCLEHCDKSKIPYCISKALINAVDGKVNDGLIFCGSNVYKVDKIVSVKSLISELTS